MLIRCPKCSICYQIEPTVLPENGRKFRCAKCGEIWICRPEDAFEPSKEEHVEIFKPEDKSEIKEGKEEAKTDSDSVENQEQGASPAESPTTGQLDASSDSVPDLSTSEEDQAKDSENKDSPANKTDKIDEKDLAINSEMEQIFSRLNKQVELIDDENKKIPLKSKLSFGIKDFFLTNKIMLAVSAVALAAVLVLSVFSFRYEIARKYPSMEGFYKLFGLESVILGEGLEFRNVVYRIYEEDYVRKIEVKGFIYNTTENELKVPAIRANVLDKDGNLLQQTQAATPLSEIKSGERAAFTYEIVHPSTLSKYIHMTFTDKNHPETTEKKTKEN